jgi:hypothetical protein
MGKSRAHKHARDLSKVGGNHGDSAQPGKPTRGMTRNVTTTYHGAAKSKANVSPPSAQDFTSFKHQCVKSTSEY